MSSTDRRRGASTSSSSSSFQYIPRPSAASSIRSSSPNHAASRNNLGGTSNGAGGVIAAPPRAALSGGGSPSPDDHQFYGPGSGAATPSSGSIKDGVVGSGPGLGLGLGLGAAAAAAAGGGSGGGNSANSTASPAAQQLLLRDRDARIAALERELGLMEGEFQRELDKLAASESETAAFWQGKHSALNQAFLRADTELRLLRAEAASAASERDELRAGWESLRRDLRDRDDDVRALREQVRGLKDWVSSAASRGGGAGGVPATSDEVFADGLARLGNGMQNWVIVHFRKAKMIDVTSADETVLAELGELVPAYEDLVSTAKIHLLQSIVSRILVAMVFDPYFVGLSPEQTGLFTQMEGVLTSLSASPEAVNQWRSTTLAMIKKGAAEELQSRTAQLVEEVISRINRVLDSITDVARTEARDQALRAQIQSAVELSRLMVVQKAVFSVTMPEILPHQRTMFDPASMEDIGGEDEEGLAQREIACVTFPGIVKRGDENGGHLQFVNTIAKARVLCSPE